MNQEPVFWRFVFLASMVSLAAGTMLVFAISALWKLGLLDIRY
jgi:hypothetical protein